MPLRMMSGSGRRRPPRSPTGVWRRGSRRRSRPAISRCETRQDTSCVAMLSPPGFLRQPQLFGQRAHFGEEAQRPWTDDSSNWVDSKEADVNDGVVADFYSGT